MKLRVFLLFIASVVFTGCTTTETIAEKDTSEKNKFKKNFTQYSKPSAILCEHFTFTKYFSDTKNLEIKESDGNLHIWGTAKVKKGAFYLTITNPKGNIVFTKVYKKGNMSTLDKVLKPTSGNWTFNITCYDTSGNYQIMAEQL